MLSTTWPLEKCKAKLQWDNVTHLLGWLKLSRLAFQVLTNMYKNYEMLTFWKSFAVSWKAQHTSIIRSSHFTPTGLPQKNGSIYPYRNLYMKVHSSFIHDSWKLETTQMSMNRWVGRQIVIYPNNRMLLSNNKNELWGISARDDLQKCCWGKEAVSAHWMAPFMKESRKDKTSVVTGNRLVFAYRPREWEAAGVMGWKGVQGTSQGWWMLSWLQGWFHRCAYDKTVSSKYVQFTVNYNLIKLLKKNKKRIW